MRLHGERASLLFPIVPGAAEPAPPPFCFYASLLCTL
ncbi:hypothetical protein CSUI_010833 [Cystoisospora suis]|uniref:Uncharacterized protein n=1 Tax=Cystoisospora suis TaxID=483139 RepID=A0A2C6KGA1_9APIC|nr:hypothetical protein CSUI_010833 [Cystoisospora suis]